MTSVAKAGWAGIKNGELLRRAELDFDLLVTVDRNLSFQQEIIGFDLAVIVLAAPSNRLRDLVPLAPRLLDVIPSCEPGRVHLVS